MVFVVWLLVGGCYLVLAGRDRWFAADEWLLLARFSDLGLSDLFADHVQHWITLPLLVYLALFRVFGLTTYVPYEMVAVVVHLGVVALIRAVMRRSGVPPWHATIWAAGLVLFGPGAVNFQFAFQITVTGALLLGLVQLVMADHAGPLNWRDWLGLAAGLAALMCSAVGVATAIMVAVAALVRRRYLAALFHSVPLAAALSAWWLVIQPDMSGVSRPEVGDLPAWTATAWAAALRGVGYVVPVAGVLAVAAALGAVLAGRQLLAKPSDGDAARGASLVAATLTGSLLFPVLIFPSRGGYGTAFAGTQRYVYVSAILLVPAMAYAVAAAARRWPATQLLLIVPLAVAVPNAVATWAPPQPSPSRAAVLAAVASPRLRTAPADLVPYPSVLTGLPSITVDWLRWAVAGNRLPAPDGATAPDDAAEADLRLRLSQGPSTAAPRQCRVVDGTRSVMLAPGEAFVFRAPAEQPANWVANAVALRVTMTTGVSRASADYANGEGEQIGNVSDARVRLSLEPIGRRLWELCR